MNECFCEKINPDDVITAECFYTLIFVVCFKDWKIIWEQSTIPAGSDINCIQNANTWTPVIV